MAVDCTKFLYLNTNHCRSATLNAIATASERNADVLLLTEPYYPTSQNKICAPGWDAICGPRSAILVRRDIVHTEQPLPHQDVVAARIDNTLVLCAYASPNEDPTGLFTLLQQVTSGNTLGKVLGGDFNCTTSLIPGYQTSARGADFEDLIAHVGLVINNTPAPTWHRGNHRSINDYILTKGVTASEYHTLEDDSQSDHIFIAFNVEMNAPQRDPILRTDPVKLSAAVRSRVIAAPILHTRADVDGFIANLTSTLQGCKDMATEQIRTRHTKLPWWTPTLTKLKNLLRALSRRIKRLADVGSLEGRVLTIGRQLIRKTYKKEMNLRRYSAFREMCTQKKPWGVAFNKAKSGNRVVMPLLTKGNGQACRNADENITHLLESKFPPPPPATPTAMSNYTRYTGAPGPPEPVSEEEVTNYIRQLPTNKSPGPDAVCTRTLKALNRHHPLVLPNLFTACLLLGYFPACWRSGRVAFVPKAGKDHSVADGYRPITLLSTLGKAYERMLNTRVIDHYDAHSPLHKHQYGFRKGIGAEEAVHQAVGMYRAAIGSHRAVAGISLDIKGAFDYVNWSCILRSLHTARAPHYLVSNIKSYFRNRQVSNGGHTINLTRGCPQGSVLGPTLWNILYDDIVRYLEGRYPGMCVYADDTFLIVTANTTTELKRKVEECIREVNERLAEIGLELSIGKTEVLTRIQKPLWSRADSVPEALFHFNVDGVLLHPKSSIKYLGVQVDSKLLFREHLKLTIEKCQRRIPLLQNLCRNMYGYGYRARKVMFNSYIHSLLMYCSSIYYQRLQLKTYRRRIDKLQRRSNVVICRGYRDISGGSAGLIAAEAPLALQLVERSVAWLLRKGRHVPYWGHLDPVDDSEQDGLTHNGEPVTLQEARLLWKSNTKEKWEKEWAEYEYSQWTHSLFPTVKSRLEVGFAPDFWITQAITGHGVFKAYLKERGLTQDSMCPCGFSEESAEHVFTECLRFTGGRPLDWSETTQDHLYYMRRVVIKLWKRENPLFHLKNPPTEEEALFQQDYQIATEEEE